VSAPLTGNREFRDDVVRLATLTVQQPRIDGYLFVNCRIVGPGVLAFGDRVTMNHCTFEADINAIFWEVDPATRPVVYGAIGMSNCEFVSCQFEAVGLAGPREIREMFERALNSE
jgi:hypothetical protein